jgi:transposase-like protein
MIKAFICGLFHRNRYGVRVVKVYSNYTHRWQCKGCGHEWDD